MVVWGQDYARRANPSVDSCYEARNAETIFQLLVSECPLLPFPTHGVVLVVKQLAGGRRRYPLESGAFYFCAPMALLINHLVSREERTAR